MLRGLRGFWSRIFAVCLLAVPWALARIAFNRKMLLLSNQPGTRALFTHPDAMMAIHKQSLEAQRHLWFYVVLCVVLPAIYVSLVELVAYLIRLIFASVKPRISN